MTAVILAMCGLVLLFSGTSLTLTRRRARYIGRHRAMW